MAHSERRCGCKSTDQDCEKKETARELNFRCRFQELDVMASACSPSAFRAPARVAVILSHAVKPSQSMLQGGGYVRT
jgi:hypothetical protein